MFLILILLIQNNISLFCKSSTIMFKNRQKALTHALLTVSIFILILNYYLRQPLYSLGLEIILMMQENHSTIGRLFFQLITTISEPIIVMIVIFGIMLGQTKRKHAFNIVMFLLLNIYFITLLKEFYSDPRPFWSLQQIHSLAFYCPGQFGNPSGHSWFSTVLCFILIFKYFPRIRRTYALTGVSVTIILVALSRMYLGAHSLNQVVMGVTLGLIMNCFYFICGLDDQITEFLDKFNSSPRLGWKKYMLLFHGLYFLAYFCSQSALEKQSKTYQIYHQRALLQCGTAHTPSSINFSMLLALSLVVNFSTGFALGYDSMCSCEKGRKYLQGSWQINQQRYPEWFGKILYYLIQIICIACGIGAAYAIVYVVRMQKWSVFLILSGGAMLSGYTYTYKSCQLLYRFSVICQIL